MTTEGTTSVKLILAIGVVIGGLLLAGAGIFIPSARPFIIDAGRVVVDVIKAALPVLGN